MLTVYHNYRFKLSLDDVVELLALRGIKVSHQTVHNWAHMVGVDIALNLRAQRKGKNHMKWHLDATYLKIHGRWYYLYRSIDKNGSLVDVMLSDTRDIVAAMQFLKQARATSGVRPSQVTTDKEPALKAVIKNVFGDTTKHRNIKFLNNRIESDHRGIKSRYKAMKHFKNPFNALRFCNRYP